MADTDPIARADEKLDILFVTSDLFPPFRPAAKAVFAEGLAARGHRIDWLLQAAEPAGASGEQRFKGGMAYVAATNAGGSRLARFKRHLADVRNDLRVFGLLKKHRYSLVQIKDKYFGALIAIVAAKLHGVPVFYWLAYPHGEASLYAARSGVARYRLALQAARRAATVRAVSAHHAGLHARVRAERADAPRLRGNGDPARAHDGRAELGEPARSRRESGPGGGCACGAADGRLLGHACCASGSSTFSSARTRSSSLRCRTRSSRSSAAAGCPTTSSCCAAKRSGWDSAAT